MRILAMAVAALFGVGMLYALYSQRFSAGSESENAGHVAGDFAQISLLDIQDHIKHLTPDARQLVMQDAQQFRKLVKAENRRRALLAAANASGIHDEALDYQIRRLTDELIIKRYVNRKMSELGVPKGFPTDTQIQQFYENNPQLFTVAERIPVWQIYWAYTPEMGDKKKVALQQQAAQVSKSLKSAKSSFAEMARQYSQHEASRLQGGFMGLLKVDELIPGIKEQVLSLKKGEISSPVVSQQGVHILLRGETVPPEKRPLKSVRLTIIEELKKRLVEQYRQKVYQQAIQQHSLTPDDANIHAWWQKIQPADGTKIQSESSGSAE